MKNFKYLSPKEIYVGDIFEVIIPLYQMPIGTLMMVYRTGEKGIYYLSEELNTFYVGNLDNSWNSFQFLQRSGISYNYVSSEFKSDLKTDYFKLLFTQFKRLKWLN